MNCSVVQVHRLAMRSLISLSAWETSISSLVTEVWDVRLSLKVTNFKTDYVWKNLRTICLSSALSPLSDRGWSQDSRVLSVRLQRNMRFSPDQSKNSTNQSVTVSPCDLWIEEHASGHNWSEIEFLDLCVGPQRCSMLNLVLYLMMLLRSLQTSCSHPLPTDAGLHPHVHHGHTGQPHGPGGDIQVGKISSSFRYFIF